MRPQQQYPEEDMEENALTGMSDPGMDNYSDSGLLSDDLGFFDAPNDQPMNKHSDLLKQLTDFDLVIKDTINAWLGRVWDSDEERYVRNPKIIPVMNERCAAWCAGLLKTYARRTNIITNLDEKQYNEIHEDIISVVWLGIGTRDDFGINNSSDLYRVCVELEHSAILVLMGAEEGKYSKLLSETSSRQEHVSYTGTPGVQGQFQNNEARRKKGGFFGSLKRGLFGGR